MAAQVLVPPRRWPPRSTRCCPATRRQKSVIYANLNPAVGRFIALDEDAQDVVPRTR